MNRYLLMIELFFAFLLGKTTFIPHHQMFSRHQSVCAAAVLETKNSSGLLISYILLRRL